MTPEPRTGGDDTRNPAEIDMKRPALKAFFAPVDAPPKEVASQVLDFFQVGSKAFFEHYYARVELDPERGDYQFTGEALDLEGRDDLMGRLERDGNSAWSLYAYIVFYPARVMPAVFRGDAPGSKTTLLLVIDPKTTRSFEDEEEGRLPFAILLAQVARSIGSNWFVCGPYLDKYQPLELDLLTDPEEYGGLYVIGWKAGAPEEAAVLSAVDTGQHEVHKTTLGYDIVIRYR